jgi:hypothetical protein
MAEQVANFDEAVLLLGRLLHLTATTVSLVVATCDSRLSTIESPCDKLIPSHAILAW